MATEIIQLTGDPVQLTSGSETAFISAINGEFCWSDSDDKPVALTISHSEMKMSVNPPFKIWAWSPATGVMVIVTKRDAD
ncbi:TPA: hypothetical protein SCS19_004129 [Enterobacter kobei]|uniref:hypothetical protein n=1 Tax=Enterobacter kobei TaxID=208224 RepID=UPI0018A5DE7B|nr:hypothetical protein [Enterobacter kobei]MBG0684014.1 hypothetical protein [Enterobacter kobei]MBW4190606.1 hypothetical protein [Enterobacter kobei]BBW23135.1 hypothetical protein STN0717ENT53_34700 [Enterobacter kobei]HDT4926567.1 hypothetical protein [Enterobacter kobei]HEG2054140.1 hypothetical protein [Enterobacter kobei]